MVLNAQINNFSYLVPGLEIKETIFPYLNLSVKF